MSVRSRIKRLEEAFSPGEVQLIHLIYAGMSPDYNAWLCDEVGAGRLRHGTLSRHIISAGNHYSDSELDALLAAENRLDETPKPYRKPPEVEPQVPAGYGVPAAPPVTSQAVPESTRETPTMVNPPVRLVDDDDFREPGRTVRFIRSTDQDSPEENQPWGRDDY